MKPATTDLPQFEFLGELGTGGTAQVCKVLTQQNKIVALKTLLQSDNISSDEFKKLAQREKTLLCGIDFPGIVKVYEVQTSDPCYISLEYCSGKTLEHYLKQDNIQTILNILSSIAVNLEFLNLKSIIHADLKPDNIFMPEDISQFASGRLTFTKLSDFSIGKFDHEEITVRAGVGTVGYMAPEVINDNIVSHKSDLFAFGVIAYQLLSGVHPFITDDADPLKINSRILEDEPLPLSNYRENIPEKLINIVSMLLEKDSAKRPTSAWEVCAMLRDAGATYQYEKVLPPKYAITPIADYDTNKFIIANYHDRLDTITNKENDKLRLLLSYNFLKNNISYDNRKFNFKSNPLVTPNFLYKAMIQFNQLQYTDKKNKIESSLYDDSHDLVASILPQFLRPATIIKRSQKLAMKFEGENNYVKATTLYLSAGELLKAENNAYQAAMQYKNENKIEDAVRLIDKVISFGEHVDRKFEIKSLYMVKGDFLKDQGDVESAEIVYNELIELYKGHEADELLAETYKDLGALYQMRKKSQEGIPSLEKALEIFKKLGNELEISKTYNNLGNMYKIKNNYSEALGYFRQALKIQRKLSASEEIASTLNNIGVTQAMKSQFKKALKIFNLSLIIQKEIGNKSEIARSLNNIGYCYEVLGETDKAVEVLQESLQYNKEIDSKKEVLYNLENLTSIMFLTGQLKKSISFLKEGIALSAELNDKPHISFFNLYMGIVLVNMGKLQEANKCFQTIEKILQEIEDNPLLVQLNLEKAQLAIFIDNKEEASHLIDKAETLSKELKDKTVNVKITLLRLSISDDVSLFAEAEEIIDEFNLTKDKSYLHALKLNHHLTHDTSYNVRQSYKSLTESLQNSDEHKDVSKLLTTLAKYEIYNDNSAQATKYITQSMQLAKSRGMLFDHFHALVLYGEILSQQKEYEKCYTVYKQSFEISKKIFVELETDADKHAFQNKREFKLLVSEIKKLSQIIGQKKEQIL